MSKLLNSLRFFEEEIPIPVLKEFDPKEAKFLAQALKLGKHPPESPRTLPEGIGLPLTPSLPSPFACLLIVLMC